MSLVIGFRYPENMGRTIARKGDFGRVTRQEGEAGWTGPAAL